MEQLELLSTSSLVPYLRKYGINTKMAVKRLVDLGALKPAATVSSSRGISWAWDKDEAIRQVKEYAALKDKYNTATITDYYAVKRDTKG